jgi:heme exporter protein CcmD
MWEMGGYAMYVWPAFGFVMVGLVLLLAQSLKDAKQKRLQIQKWARTKG